MSTDEYVPDEQDFIDSWACAHVTPHDMTAEEAKDVARTFLARVRRDAWTEGCRAAEQYYRRTVVGIPGLDPIPAPVNPHEETP